MLVHHIHVLVLAAVFTSVSAPPTTQCPGPFIVGKLTTLECFDDLEAGLKPFPLVWSTGGFSARATREEGTEAHGDKIRYRSFIDLKIAMSHNAAEYICTTYLSSGALSSGCTIRVTTGPRTAVIKGPETAAGGERNSWTCAVDGASGQAPTVDWKFGNGSTPAGKTLNQESVVTGDDGRETLYQENTLTLFVSPGAPNFTLVCCVYHSLTKTDINDSIRVIVGESACAKMDCGPGRCARGVCDCSGTAFTGLLCDVRDLCFGVNCGPGRCKKGVCDCSGTHRTGPDCTVPVLIDDCLHVNCGPGLCVDGICDCSGTAYVGPNCSMSIKQTTQAVTNTENNFVVFFGMGAGILVIVVGTVLALHFGRKSRARGGKVHRKKGGSATKTHKQKNVPSAKNPEQKDATSAKAPKQNNVPSAKAPKQNNVPSAKAPKQKDASSAKARKKGIVSSNKARKQAKVSSDKASKQANISSDKAHKQAKVSSDKAHKQANVSSDKAPKHDNGPPPEKAPRQVDIPADQVPKQADIPADQVPKQADIPADQIPKQADVPADQVPTQANVPVDQVPKQADVPADQIPKQADVPADEVPKQADVSAEKSSLPEPKDQSDPVSAKVRDSSPMPTDYPDSAPDNQLKDKSNAHRHLTSVFTALTLPSTASSSERDTLVSMDDFL